MLDVLAQAIAEQRGAHRIGAGADYLDHLIAEVIDDIDVVAQTTEHDIGAEAAIQGVVARAAVEDVVTGQTVEHVVAAQAEDMIVQRRTVERIGRVGTHDHRAGHHRGGRRVQRLEGAAVIGVADLHPHLLAGLSRRQGEGLRGGAGGAGDLGLEAVALQPCSLGSAIRAAG